MAVIVKALYLALLVEVLQVRSEEFISSDSIGLTIERNEIIKRNQAGYFVFGIRIEVLLIYCLCYVEI